MSYIVIILISLTAGYMAGSINTSIIVGKAYGVDIRKKGSGNAGATNALRTLGKKAALFVFLGDAAKGILACLAGVILANLVSGGESAAVIAGKLSGGMGAVLGHNWPVYFGFKGGKGILTSFAVIMMVDYRAGLILFGLFIITLAAFRYVSLGSVAAAAALPVIMILMNGGTYIAVFSVVLAILAIYRHKANIIRLIKGSESKLTFRRTA